MRLLTFLDDGAPQLGFLAENGVLDPRLAGSVGRHPCFRSALDFISSGTVGLDLASGLLDSAAPEAIRPRESVRLCAPIYPTTILCTGSNYRDHNEEKAASPVSGKEPEFFIKTADCVIGPEEAIPYDTQLTTKLDCETELAIVIGKPGRHIAVADALDHVFGYTIVNDVTARDRQVRRSNGFTWYELGRGKAFDGSAPL